MYLDHLFIITYYFQIFNGKSKYIYLSLNVKTFSMAIETRAQKLKFGRVKITSKCHILEKNCARTNLPPFS